MNFRPSEPHTTSDKAISVGTEGGGFIDTDLIVFIEPNCAACDRVVATARELHRMGVVEQLTILDSIVDPSASEAFGVFVYPSTYMNGRLAFHGEFSLGEFLKLYTLNGDKPVTLKGKNGNS